jgi:prohibitin 2
VNYSISPDAVQELFNDVGPDWFDRLVEPRVQNFFKEETVKYSTVDIAPNREVLRRAVRDRLAEDLEKYSITVQDLLIDNLDFRPEFKNAIESKQIATQDALREEERIRQSEAEAQQGVAVASGRAQETIITATAEAEANRLISASLDANVLSIRAIEAFGDDIDIALIPSGEGLILDPATLLRGTAPTEGE